MGNILLKAAQSAFENVDRKQFKELNPINEADLKALIQNSISDDELKKEILIQLFPKGITLDETLFEKFHEFYVLLGFHSIVNQLIGELCFEIFKNQKTEEVNNLLNSLTRTNTNDRYFWIFIRNFQYLLIKYSLEPDFAADWFYSICEKMGNNLASGDFYLAIGNFGYYHPIESIHVINKYSQSSIDLICLNISGILMGNIRVSKMDKGDFSTLEKNYSTSSDENKRAIYYSSFLSTYFRTEQEVDDDMISLLNNAMKDTDKIKEQAFYIVNRYINFKRKDNALKDFGLSWILENINSTSSDMCKYYVIDLIRWLLFDKLGDKNKEIDLFEKINKIFKKTLPINENNGGTWANIQDILIDLVTIDTTEFEKTTLILLYNSTNEFLKYLKDRQFDHLMHQLENININSFILKLVISRIKIERELGFLFLKFLHVNFSGEDSLTTKDETTLKISLLDFRRKAILGREISDYLLTVEPFFRNVSLDLKKEFIREMVFQAINYPGECLGKWKKLESPSDIIISVIKSADLYFENIESTYDLPVNSYVLPVFIKAEKESKRRFSKSVYEGAYEKSIFMKLVKTTNILYGNKWSISYDNKVGDPSSFGEISHSFEFPRIDYIDPEGMAIRRLMAGVEINKLSQ